MIFNLFLLSNFYTHGAFESFQLLIFGDSLFLLLLLSFIANKKLHLSRMGLILILLLIVQNIISYIFLLQNIEVKLFLDNINLIYCFLIFCISLYIFLSYSQEDFDKTFQYWLVGSVLSVLVCYATLFGLGLEEWRLGVRINGSFKAINQAQSFIGPALIISLYFYVSRSNKIIYLLIYLNLIILLLLTGSRASLIPIALSILYIAFMTLLDLRNKGMANVLSNFAIFGIVMFSAGFLLNFLIFPAMGIGIDDFGSLTRLVDKLDEAAQGDLGPRQVQFQIVSENFYKYFFGIGFGTFQEFFDYRNEVHNTYLGVLIENGVLFFMIFIIFYVLMPIIFHIFLLTKKMPLLHCIFFIHYCLVSYQLTVYGFRQRIFWIELALIIAYLNYLRQSNARQNI